MKTKATSLTPVRKKCVIIVGLLLTCWVSVPIFFLSFKPYLSAREPAIITAATIRRESKPSATVPHGDNILCIFTGRWKFLRVNFPYVYRDLRRNGGVLDKVYYIMIQYDRETSGKLHNLTRTVNRILGEDVFQFRYLNNLDDKQKRPRGVFARFYYLIFDELVHNPRNKYFKMDDDIVYIHPGAFWNMIEQQNSSTCFIHFGNIVSNWRCNYIHQEMGVFSRDINHENLHFQFSPHAKCGWKSPRCASLALNAFLYHYHNDSLEKYVFKGLYLTPDRSRFSINFMLLDLSLIDLKPLLESGPISIDDEQWWTEIYSAKVKNPNCVVGRAFVVHFSYYTTIDEMLKRGFLAKFETIVQTNFNATLPQELKKTLDFSSTFQYTVGHSII